MNTMPQRKLSRRFEKRLGFGQTLPAALIVLGVLLIVGTVFLGIINRNILQAGVSKQRSASEDLSEAGVRFAHSQLLYSPLGADWRGFATPPVSLRDPDYDFLRPDPGQDPNNPYIDPDPDEGGPDQLGPYTRVNYGNGRFLVRVRYAPSDAFLFSTAPNGPLRQPGRARNYLIIESVGRVGRVNPQDPSTLIGRDRRESTKLIAFASVGVIEHAMFITNRDRVSAPADIGVPRPFGVTYEGLDVQVPLQLGDAVPMFNFGNPPTPNPSPVILGGGIYSNADLVWHGRTDVNLNMPLGDAVLVNGMMRGADLSASLFVNRAFWDSGLNMWQSGTSLLTNFGTPSLDSRSNGYLTISGLVRDAVDGTDVDGWWRAVGRKEPPSHLRANPDTGLNRYLQSTRDSGLLLASGNSGRFGHGQGPYVNNTQDRQMRADEGGRETVGSSESLVYDWFNPNNGQANSGWMGPYYIPRGALLLLQYDGFTIIRDGRATGIERNWRTPDGVDTGSQTCRFRIGLVNGRQYVINSFTPGVNVNSPNPNFALGQPFNGVLYFEGNVRVRGVIPTDAQMTVVSNATVYVEGSIVKGVARNHLTDPSGPPSPPQRLNRPSGSTIMLMAKDYVAVNTTMFFGPSPFQALEEVNEQQSPVAWNPIRVRTAGGTFTFRSDLLWDPASGLGPALPNSWLSFVEGYSEFGAPGNRIATRVHLSHATDDGPAPYTFVSMDVNFGLPAFNYLFAMVAPNAAAPFFNPPQAFGAIYGLGSESWQRYPKLESTAFPLLDPTALVSEQNGFVLRANTPASAGDYRMLVGEMNDLSLRHNQVGFGATNDYLLARTALLPHDIRIEASLFAEEGSFVVIPGNWFNPNPNDTRTLFNQRVTDFQAAPYNMNQADAVRAAIRERQESFGSGPEMPFHSEPVDVKVTIFGAVSQNMPLPLSYQGEWLRKWGWIPRQTGAMYRFSGANATPILIPQAHVPAGYDILNADRYVPNFTIVYDPALATASANGFGTDYIRRDRFGRPLPPMPRLPVSPVLSYFGEVLR